MSKWLLALGILGAAACWKPLPAARDGDIIFQTSLSNQSLAVQRATKSPYSHMGIIFLRDGQPYVLEASAAVRFTPLAKWIQHGRDGHFVLKRLKDVDARLTPDVVEKLRAAAQTFVGRPYDLTFEWSDDRIYCSELVWKIYQRGAGIEIGALQTMKDFDLTSPAVAAKLRERFGNKVPLNETVISPAAMFDSTLLTTVETR
jgi:hypothetical protein